MSLSDLPLVTDTAPLVLLGCGRMGGALLEGWLENGLPGSRIAVIEPSPSGELTALCERNGARLLGTAEELETAPGALLIAIKPQMMGAVLPGIAERFGATPLYISIAAGTTLARFESVFGSDARIVRVMPNTPVAVGRGASALYANTAGTEADRSIANALMRAVGETVWLSDEAQMDAVTALSGSGPAYVFHLIEALAAAGEAEGLAPDLSMTLARQTVIGAALLAEASDAPAGTLRENVTSPGGTTAAALGVLMETDSGLAPLMRAAIRAAAQRSRELSG